MGKPALQCKHFDRIYTNILCVRLYRSSLIPERLKAILVVYVCLSADRIESLALVAQQSFAMEIP